jgi:hypothetical protein
MAVDVDALVAEVEKTKGLAPSVATFINDLKAALDAELASDPAAQAKVDAALNDLIASNEDIAAAIAANP